MFLMLIIACIALLSGCKTGKKHHNSLSVQEKWDYGVYGHKIYRCGQEGDPKAVSLIFQGKVSEGL